MAVGRALVRLGTSYAATDGVLSALTSRVLPDALRSSGLALVQTVVALGKLVSALTFGALWSYAGLSTALTAFAVALGLGIAVVVPLLRAVASASR
jgi:hypothetical protein